MLEIDLMEIYFDGNRLNEDLFLMEIDLMEIFFHFYEKKIH